MLKEKSVVPPEDFKPYERPGEQIGGGFIIARKGRWGGRLKIQSKPFEHPTYESATKELKRLSELYPNLRFVILAEVGQTVFFSEES